jgi:hypothetical protein
MKVYVWLLRETRGMVKMLLMNIIICRVVYKYYVKWEIRSQVPKPAMIGYGNGSETKW